MPPVASSSSRSVWKWGVCGLLLLATMINYMDRLTLNLMARRIKVELLSSDNGLYANLESGFGLAFAAGAIISGLVVDRVGVRLYYPLMVLAWSAAGFATGFARSYEELLVCRTLLGFFEAANWPCALYTTQRVLSSEQRTMGNGILQSGAAVGAVLTPLVIMPFLTVGGSAWRYPFLIIGAIGGLWAVLWLVLIRPGTIPATATLDQPTRGSTIWSVFADRRFWVLAFVVVAINTTWHFFRAWMPLFLQEQHRYSERFTTWFVLAYYVATDLGSLAAGAATLALVGRGLSAHASRMVTFLFLSLLCLLTFAAASLPRGPLLLAMLLLIGFAALGLFPNYYSFTQELSARHQGKVTGALGCICWLAMAAMQKFVGWMTQAPEGMPQATDYRLSIALAGVPPLLAFGVLLLFWRSPIISSTPQPVQSNQSPEPAVS